MASAGQPVKGSVVLVTGANGGIGQALVEAFRAAGAAEVIAAVRPGKTAPAGTTPCALDVSDPASVATAASLFAQRVDILVNNAGVNGNGRLFAPGAEAAARSEMEVNYLGLLGMIRAFAPAMQARRSGAVVNLLSFLAHVNLPVMATYCASKAAAYSLTQAARAELARFGVRVLGVFPRLVDTAMSGHISAPKLSPAELAGAIVNALEQGVDDLYPGNAVEAYEAFRKDPGKLEREFAARLPD
ncbi:MAG TPA: SDR family NAD(P)-dependent oxidoreductase [Burkholderiales bacterium]|nr:SDR family NAD(P)-dependent oxidoreductase [Burkholderiales bacterium]